jgi:DNA mismatch repair ATPase MutS
VFGGATLTALDDWLWQSEDAEALLIKHFGVRSLDGFGLTGKTEAIMSAGACLRYAIETQRGSAAHINDLIYFEPQDHLVLDNITVRNLELIKPLSSDGSRDRYSTLSMKLRREWARVSCAPGSCDPPSDAPKPKPVTEVSPSYTRQT